MPEGVELPGVDPADARFIGFRLEDKPDGSLLTQEAAGVFGPIICVSWEEARYYALLERSYTEHPFELSRERLAAMSIIFGFNGIHIYRIHEGKTYRRTESFK